MTDDFHLNHKATIVGMSALKTNVSVNVYSTSNLETEVKMTTELSAIDNIKASVIMEENEVNDYHSEPTKKCIHNVCLL